MFFQFIIKNFKNLTIGSTNFASHHENPNFKISLIECNPEYLVFSLSEQNISKDNIVQFRFIINIGKHIFDFVMNGKVISVEKSNDQTEPLKVEVRFTQFNKKDWLEFLNLIENKQIHLNDLLLQLRGFK